MQEEFLIYAILIIHSMALGVLGSCIINLDQRVKDLENDRLQH